MSEGKNRYALCLRCGLCCNGVLFGDGKLRRADDADRLKSLGLEVERFDDGQYFLQPCGGFDGCRCTIYADRPTMCRKFECGVLKRQLAGTITESTAFSVISEALGMVGEVRRLLEQCGERSEDLPLGVRFESVMSEPIDLEADDEGDLRGELMNAMGELMTLLESEFLSEEEG